MNIRVLNNDLTSYGILAGLESLEFIRAFNTKGCFRLKINANNKTAKYIKIDKILYIDTEQIGYIDKITYDRKSDGAGEYIIAEGVEIKDRLNRIIYPDAGLESDVYTNEYLETIIKSLINKNAGSSASVNRRIPNITTAANQNRGQKIDYSARYKDLSTEIYSLLKSQEMGLKATIDFDSNEIIFDVTQGNDLKAQQGMAGGIVLSLDTKTALEIVDTDDQLSYKNVSVTGGLGEGADRTIQEVYIGAEPTGFDRKEVFADAGDINNDDELATRGAQKLSDISKTRAITVKANNLGSYQVGDDYKLGDYISVDAKDGYYDAQVVKIKVVFEKSNAPQIYPLLNFDVNDTLYAAITAKHMDYDALAAKSNKFSSFSKAAFLATLDADTSQATGTVVQFDSLVWELKEGSTSNYNPSTYQYTVPITGYYYIACELAVASPYSGTRYGFKMNKNLATDPNEILQNRAHTSNTGTVYAHAGKIVYLEKEDEIFVRTTFASTETILSGDRISYFTCALLKESA